MIRLEGKPLRDEILAEVAAKVAALDDAPWLTVVQVGDDPASGVYIRNKLKACERTGIRGEHLHLDAGISQAVLNDTLAELSASARDGILLQMPLPAGLDDAAAMDHLDPDKDVDGFHPANLGKLMAGRPGLVPCTPAGLRLLLERGGFSPRGKDVVVVGRSLIVGKPAAMLFLEKGAMGDATVTVCHSASADLAAHCRRADILVTAVGRAGLVTGDMVKDGVVVVDVGMNRVADPAAKRGYRLVGDCDFPSVSARAAAMTPVPGGVGPMTIAMLMRNTLAARELAVAR